MTVSVNKSIMERYDIHVGEGYQYLAIIAISEDGLFNVQSDFGNFSYRWDVRGESFKKLLIDLGKECNTNPTGYLYDILRSKKGKVDVAETLEELKQVLINMRREERVGEIMAREAWDAMNSLAEENEYCSEEIFFTLLYGSGYITSVFDHDDFNELELKQWKDVRCRRFCEVIMPVFAKALEEENQTK